MARTTNSASGIDPAVSNRRPKRALSVTPDAECCAGLVGSRFDEGVADALAQAFSALGDPVRLRLLNLIAESADGEVCVCDLVPAVGRSQPTVSHHLRILGEAGLVAGERRGKWVWYSVNRSRLHELRAALDPRQG